MTSASVATHSFVSRPVSTDRLKILFLANRIPVPIRDGQSRRTYHILRGLAEEHEVHLLSMYETPEESQPGTREHLRAFCATVEMMPAPPKRVSAPMAIRVLRSVVSRDPYTIWRHYSQTFLERVHAAIATGAFDVVHCDNLPIAYTLRGANAAFLTVTDHDVSYLKAARVAQGHRNPLMRLFMRYEALKLRRLEQQVSRSVDLTVTVSETDRIALTRLSPQARFAVVENGVDVGKFVPDPSVVESSSMVWMGGFHHAPNVEAVRFFLEDVYPRIKAAHRAAKLYLVGGDVPPAIAALAARDPSVVMTGFVDDPLVYIQRAAVFVAPVLSGSGTKLKVLEAMAAGKAIVSTTLGVEGIEGRDREHFMVADDAATFAALTIQLLSDLPLRDQLGARARALAEQKYDWRAICAKANALYRTEARRAPVPRVLIAIATDAIGGPGKGLFQFLTHFPADRGEYVLCNFNLKNRPPGEFIEEARRRRLPLQLLNQRALLDPSLVLQARALVRDRGINVIQTHGYKSNILGFLLRRLTGLPWVGFAHGLTDDNRKMRIYNALDLYVLRHADRVVTVSQSMKMLLERHHVPAENIRVVYNAVEPSGPNRVSPAALREELRVAPHRRVIGVVGRLNPEKGHVYFLEAMEQILREHPDVHALLIGDGQERPSLEEYCRAHALTEHVTFTGYRSDVAACYQAFDLLVLPSLSEGLPNTLLEAMSWGVPVVASNVGGVPEVIDGTNGVLVPPADAKRLAAAISDLFACTDTLREIGERGRESLQPRFAPEHRARQILRVYDELLTPGRTRRSHM